ncbi:MAG TPA: PAS domain S-box protein [Verrucomicrobiae bacterium]|nr:PAS domain S-box protein [Verrucomicrobiae bacterium]
MKDPRKLERLPPEMAMSQLAAIVESSDDAIIGKDLNSIVTSWNQGAEKIFGYTAEEMVGTSILRLFPADRQDEENFILGKIKSGEKVEHFETLRQTKDGRLIHVSVTASPIKDNNGNIIGASKIARDITAQKQQEREFARLTRLYAALSQVNQAIVWMPTQDELFQKVCRVLIEHGGFHMAWIGWHNLVTRQIMPVAVCGDEQDYIRSIKIYADDRPEGRGPTGLAFRSGRPYICNDMLNDPVTVPWRPELVRRGFNASAVFPIRSQNKVCATLTVYSDEPWFFQDKEIALLTEAAGDISFALDNFAEKAARQQAGKIAESERLFSATMIESMPGIVYFYDAQGKFLRWNKNFETTSGYSAGEIARMHPLDFFPAGEKERLQQRIAEVFERGESFIEAVFVSKDGRTTPYFFTGKRVLFDGQTCLVGMGVDISERKRAEELLRASEGRYRTLFERAPDGIVIANTQGRYLDGNSSICRMLGYAREELIGLHSSDIVVPEQIQHVTPALEAIQSQSDYHREWQFRRKDGSIFPAEVIATMMPDGNIMAMIRDITERKRAEQALRVLNQTLELEVAARTSDLQAALVRAEAADRIKSAFLATMSHELRTPLNSIIGFTGIVLQGLAGPLNAEQTKQLGMVRNSSRHLLELINDVLDLSKIEAGQLEIRAEPFTLRDSLERVIALVKPLADKKSLKLSIVALPGLGEIFSDRRRVEQLLINLVNNAIKFTERGDVTVTAEKIAAYQSSADAPPQPAIRLRVTDTGMGIKPEDLATLFQPFRQIDSGMNRQHEGTGLGLVICRRLATLLGGEISARSEWSKGSEFTVTLPVQKPATP